jgi:hypothetical protein
MKLGNYIASIGIILSVIGLLCMPFIWNPHELPYIADPAYPKGSGWYLLVSTGIFARPGLILLVLGVALLIIAKLLPKKYWGK